MLTITNVKKTFNKGTVNEKKALNGINLHLAPGDFVTIIGATIDRIVDLAPRLARRPSSTALPGARPQCGDRPSPALRNLERLTA